MLMSKGYPFLAQDGPTASSPDFLEWKFEAPHQNSAEAIYDAFVVFLTADKLKDRYQVGALQEFGGNKKGWYDWKGWYNTPIKR